MAKVKGNVKVVTIKCSEDNRSTYQTIKNIKNVTERLKLKKYNPFLRRHTLHVEVKK